MKSSIKNLLCILLLLIAPQVFAGPFDPPPTDESVTLLGTIFGASVGNIYLGGAANPVLSSLMEQLNFIIVVVGIVVVGYVAVLSTINTAHEGTAMGKKWSAVWMPMRSVAGMGLMIPAPASGYSMIQVTVMWIIIQGVGAADSLWNIALQGLSSGVSATTGTLQDPSLNPASSPVQNLVKTILDAAACMQTLYAQASLQENVQQNNWVSQFGTSVANFSIQDAPIAMSGTDAANNRVTQAAGWSYFGVNNGDPGAMTICGRVRVVGTVTEQTDLAQAEGIGIFASSGTTPTIIPDSTMQQMAQSIYNAKLQAISAMLYVVNPLVTQLVNGTYATSQYSALTGANPQSPNLPPPGYNQAAANAYVLTMGGLVVPYSATSSGAVPQTGINYTSAQLQSIISAGELSGWVTAGSFYFVFNKTFNSLLFQSANPKNDPITVDLNNPVPNCDTQTCINAILGSGIANSSATPSVMAMQNKENILQNTLNAVATNIANAEAFLATDTQGLPPVLSLPTPGVDSSSMSQVFGIIILSGSQIITLMSQLMQSLAQGSGGDPLLAHALFGGYVMQIIEDAFMAIVAAVFSLGIAGILSGILFPAIGMFFATVAEAVLFILAIFAPIMAVIWTLGAMLAVYCPLIPYMMFTMGVVGWFLVVTEAIVAAPIIALGLVLPSGDELGKIIAALTILANIFLRPMLMIFGFLLAANVFRAVIQLIDYGMASVFNTLNVNTTFSFIVVLFVYVMFVVSVTNVCFALIYALPDKILRWIGSTPEQTDAHNIQEVKSMAQAASSEVGKGMGDVTQLAGKKATELSNKAIAKRTGGGDDKGTKPAGGDDDKGGDGAKDAATKAAKKGK